MRVARLERHVLKYARSQLQNMPKGARGGRRPVFTRKQAFRLALCGHLNASGLNLKDSARATAYITKQIRYNGKQLPKRGRRKAFVYDGKYVRFGDDSAWFSTATWRISPVDKDYKPVRTTVVDLQMIWDIGAEADAD